MLINKRRDRIGGKSLNTIGAIIGDEQHILESVFNHAPDFRAFPLTKNERVANTSMLQFPCKEP